MLPPSGVERPDAGGVEPRSAERSRSEGAARILHNFCRSLQQQTKEHERRMETDL